MGIGVWALEFSMIKANNNPIGIFDSGIGGLTVLKKIKEILKNEDFVYFCDTKNAPYGSRKPEEIKKFVFESMDFLVSKKVKAVVIACNTATSVVIDDLREKLDFPVIGMEPAIKPAIEAKKEGKILVLATPVTLEQEKFALLKEKIDVNNDCIVLPVEELADMIEKHIVKYADKFEYSNEIHFYLEGIFSEYPPEQISAIVLGCTHYGFLLPYLKKLIPEHIKIFDGSLGTAKYLEKVLVTQGSTLGAPKVEPWVRPGGKIQFFSSGYDFIDLEKTFNQILDNYL